MHTKTRRHMAQKKVSVRAVAAFFASLVLCGLILLIVIVNKGNADRLLMEQLIMEKTGDLAALIHKLLYKTEALSALVIQSNGEVNNFERVASTLLDDPAIANVLLAPDGIVTHVYPMHGHEAVIGFDFFTESAGNKEAILAKETGQLVFGGPFSLVQGGQALVGRLPVFMESENGENAFWGLVSVTLKYPQVLNGLGLALLEKQGFAFEIWRINPDTGTEQMIANSDYPYDTHARTIEKSLEILNAVWHFRLAPVKAWYHYAETWVVIAFSVFVSFLLSFIMQNNHELKQMQRRLEELAQSDPLTGIANRRHFMHTAQAQLQLAARKNQDCFLIMLDVDHFKRINDTYSHAAGDMVLNDLADRVKRIIRPYDLFARYGGEEFILLVTDVKRNTAEEMATRMRLSFCESPFFFGDMQIAVSASLGLARIAPGESLEAAIRQADEALYTAKREGRNRTCVYDDTEMIHA